MMLSVLAKQLNARFIGSDLEVTSFSTDSRNIHAEDMFIALRGPNFNGHDFLESAFSQGAIAALVDDGEVCDQVEGKSFLVVEDTLRAYGSLASVYAASMPARKIAITGSCGKTSVKNLLASILSGAGSVLATQGNLNNEIGVPKTLLSIEPFHDFAVIEMGANHKGEIGYLSALVKADVVTVLNADRAHLEGFGSVDDVASAKGEIFSGAKDNGCAVLSLDEKYFEQWKTSAEAFGLSLTTCSIKDESADVFVSDIIFSEAGSKFQVHAGGNTSDMVLPLLGEHNIKNAMIAISIAITLGMDLESISVGLKKASVESGRLQLKVLKDKSIVIDDSYNANPLSVKAAIDVLSQFSQNKVLILGDMAELGELSEELHGEIGNYAKEKQIDSLLTCGKLSVKTFESFSGSGESFSDQASLLEALPEVYQANKGSVYLVKGSRSARMEKVVDSLIELGEAA